MYCVHMTRASCCQTEGPCAGMQAIGKPHSLWCAFAKFYEKHGDIANARVIFDKATEVNPPRKAPCSGKNISVANDITTNTALAGEINRSVIAYYPPAQC